jgi:protein TonB
MVALANLSREERIGLLIAGTAHVALAMVLMLQNNSRTPIAPPQRITVSLAEEVALDTASPDPLADPAAALSPVLAPVPEPEVLEQPEPKPTPRVRPTPTPTASRRPTPTPTASRRPTPTASASRRPTPTPTPTRAGGGRVSEESMRGLTDGTGERGSPGDRPSATQQASIDAAIIRQLKPHWSPPSGVDVDRLVTVVRFRLNRDGTLNGAPEVLTTTGQTASNRAQVTRHQEQAIRAVRLAAPFNLPERFYSGWSVVTSNFDNRLAQ